MDGEELEPKEEIEPKMYEEHQEFIDKLQQELQGEAQEQDDGGSAMSDSSFDFEEDSDDALDPDYNPPRIIRFDLTCPLF